MRRLQAAPEWFSLENVPRPRTIRRFVKPQTVAVLWLSKRIYCTRKTFGATVRRKCTSNHK